MVGMAIDSPVSQNPAIALAAEINIIFLYEVERIWIS
jgi:hypothetical protein